MKTRYVPHLFFRCISCFAADERESSPTGTSEENSILRFLYVIHSHLSALSIDILFGGLTRRNIRHRQSTDVTKYVLKCEIWESATYSGMIEEKAWKYPLSISNDSLNDTADCKVRCWCWAVGITTTDTNDGLNKNGRKKYNNWTQVFWTQRSVFKLVKI